MQIKMLTPAEVAAFTMRLTGGKADPEVTAFTYRENARVMREYAAKAARKPNGKYCGYTEAEALASAEENERRAVSVPAEIRKLLAAQQ